MGDSAGRCDVDLRDEEVMDGDVDHLRQENEKLKEALKMAIPWIGQARSGPEWATELAKKRNAAMCDRAFEFVFRTLYPDG
jgi:hypothetical protein